MPDTAEIKVPCAHLKKIPKIPNVNNLGMFDLKGMLDFTVGAPHDCTLAINLMLQISPLLASMSCLLKILAVIKAMEKFVKNPLTETTELLEKIGDVAGCFVALIPLNVAITIKGI